MSIIRIEKKERPFVQVDKECINHPELSFKAKGLHTYLMSKPDDWTFYLDYLTKVSCDGRDGVRSAMKELEDAGYLRRTRLRNKNGTWGEVQTIVRETSTLPVPPSRIGLSEVGSTSMGRPNATNNDITKKEDTNNEYISSDELEVEMIKEARILGWDSFRVNLCKKPKPVSLKPLLFDIKDVAAHVRAQKKAYNERGSSMSVMQKIGMINELDQQLAADGVVVA